MNALNLPLPAIPRAPARVLLRWTFDAGLVGFAMECRRCGHHGWYERRTGVPCPECNAPKAAP